MRAAFLFSHYGLAKDFGKLPCILLHKNLKVAIFLVPNVRFSAVILLPTGLPERQKITFHQSSPLVLLLC